jgi:hypothetical protein
MARIWKSRKTFAAICALALVLIGVIGESTPASSLSLPLETPTVKVPAVPVKVPTVTVKTPTVTVPPVTVKTPPVTVKTPTVTVPPVTVKTPPVTVKTPPVTVKAPTVTVKTPTAPVKAPTVSVKTTTPVKTTTTVKTPSVPGKAPAITVKTPPVSVKSPTITVKTPAGSVKTTGSASAPSVSLKTGSASGSRSSSTAAAHSGTPTTGPSSGSASSPSGGSGTASSPLGTYSPGAGYGELPPIEGATGTHARARIARRERRLKAMVAHFQGCLDALPASQRTLLELRTGYGPGKPLSPRATAVRLHLGAAQVAHLEKQALHELTAAASTHDCSQTGAVVNGVMSFIATNFGGTGPQATGGVKAVRYESAPIKPAGKGTSTVGGILGANISPTASDVILILALLMALGTIVALVIADAAGQGPRHEVWRQRVMNRLRSLR